MEKKICICLFFVLMLYIKFQVPGSSAQVVSSFNTNKQSDGQDW